MAHLQYQNKHPNHSELYRDLHIIEDAVIREIFRQMGWEFYRKSLFSKSKTEYSSEIEYKNWDIIFRITETPESKLNEYLYETELDSVPLLIEYKSSLKEWGRQLDQHIRQIKNRFQNSIGIPVLLTFDSDFKEYEQAFRKAGIVLIVLPETILNKENKL